MNEFLKSSYSSKHHLISALLSLNSLSMISKRKYLSSNKLSRIAFFLHFPKNRYRKHELKNIYYHIKTSSVSINIKLMMISYFNWSIKVKKNPMDVRYYLLHLYILDFFVSLWFYTFLHHFQNFHLIFYIFDYYIMIIMIFHNLIKIL